MHFLAVLASLGSKLMKKKKKKAKSLCKVVPQGQIQGGLGRGKYYVNYLGRLILLDFGLLLVNNSLVPSPILQYKKLSLRATNDL